MTSLVDAKDQYIGSMTSLVDAKDQYIGPPVPLSSIAISFHSHPVPLCSLMRLLVTSHTQSERFPTLFLPTHTRHTHTFDACAERKVGVESMFGILSIHTFHTYFSHILFTHTFHTYFSHVLSTYLHIYSLCMCAEFVESA